MSKSPMYWLVSLIAAMLIGLIAAYATMRPGTGRPTQALPLTDPVAYEGMQIIPFEMVDQNGNTQNQEILQGHWTVMSFMFTHCVLACPT
ncbi:MAG: SCO family protein, partial [Phycisphaerales bacterium JB065]